MDEFKVFTLNPNGFPLKKMRKLVDFIHRRDQHYVLMVDPGKQAPLRPFAQMLTRISAIAYQVALSPSMDGKTLQIDC